MNPETTLELELPSLAEGRFASVRALTDETLFRRCGVRIAFTGREGGVSASPYDSLNLGSHVDDDLSCVDGNRSLLQDAFGARGMPLVVPNQVHGDTVLNILDVDDASRVSLLAQEGCDGLVVESSGVIALLCFADCMPVILVSPSGRFAVVHAGWRGVECEIAAKAVEALSCADRNVGLPGDPSSFNAYFGPHIRSECFETSEEIHARFVGKFGEACSAGFRHVDLSIAQTVSLNRAGIVPERICDAGICTVCNVDRYYSYRAQNGVCGRHGALAFRIS